MDVHTMAMESQLPTETTVLLLLDTNVTMLEEFENDNYLGMTKWDVAKYVAQEMLAKQHVEAVILLKTEGTHHHFYRDSENIAADSTGDNTSNSRISCEDNDNDNDDNLPEVHFPNLTEWTAADSDNLPQRIENLIIPRKQNRKRKLSEISKNKENATAASTAPQKGDFLNGLIVAADTLYRSKTQARVVLLTDGRHKAEVDQKQLLVAMDSLRKWKCRLDVVFFGSDCSDDEESDNDHCDSDSEEEDDEDDEENDEDDDEIDLDDIQSQNRALLRNLASKLNGTLLVPNSINDILSNLAQNHEAAADQPVQVTSEPAASANSPQLSSTRPIGDKMTSPVVNSQKVARVSLSSRKYLRNETSLHIQQNGWIQWNGSDNVSLDEWLQKIRPSAYTANPAAPHAMTPFCAWIYVVNVNKDPNIVMDEERTLHLTRYMSPLNNILQIIRSGPSVRVPAAAKRQCVNEIMRLAKEDNQTVGKWLVYVPKEVADSVWEKIARATAMGNLGCGSKVSPTAYAEKPTVICVYVNDSTDKRDVQRVLKTLRDDLGIEDGLNGVRLKSFKPDIFTHLDIYSNNMWRLKPSLYSVKEALGWVFGKEAF